MAENQFDAHVAIGFVTPVPNEATDDAAWSRASSVSKFGVDDAYLVALCAHIQEL